MSIKTRVSKLEERANPGLQIIIPVRCDSNGGQLQTPIENEEVQIIRFDSLQVRREDDEDYCDFSNRAYALAVEAFLGAIVCDPRTQDIL